MRVFDETGRELSRAELLAAAVEASPQARVNVELIDRDGNRITTIGTDLEPALAAQVAGARLIPADEPAQVAPQ